MYYRTLIRRLKSDDFLAHFSKCVSNRGGGHHRVFTRIPLRKTLVWNGFLKKFPQTSFSSPRNAYTEMCARLIQSNRHFCGGGGCLPCSAVSIALALCVSVSLCLCVSVSLSLSLSLSTSLSMFLPACLSFYLSIYLSTHLSVYLSIFLSFFLSILIHPFSFIYLCLSFYA